MKLSTFKKKYENGSKELNGMSAEFVYESYYVHIKPYLPMIESFLSKEKVPTEKVLRSALGVTTMVWNACKMCFEEFREAVELPNEYMELKAQIDLQKGLQNTEFKNPKILEMQLQRYDTGYKKQADVEVELPRTLEINIIDASIDEKILNEEEEK